MNKIYTLVWNQSRRCWTVAGEHARRHGKSGTGVRRAAAAIACVASLATLSAAHAVPTGGVIVSGQGHIQTDDLKTQVSVNQSTQKMIINWRNFSISEGNKVSFTQPNATSIALNKVLGYSGSDIRGSIVSNGRVFLVNPNGILFGPTAQVDVGGLVASAQNIDNDDFLRDNYHFKGDYAGDVANLGKIVANGGGGVALLGAKVDNQGMIQAQLGRVALGAGRDFLVTFDGAGMLDLQVTGAEVAALAQNGGRLSADGGQVLVTAHAANAALKTVVNNRGIIEARTLHGQAGAITLDGGTSGVVLAAGRMNATAVNSQGNGGTVQMRGQDVHVLLGTEVDTRSTHGATGVWQIESRSITADNAGTLPLPTIHVDTLNQNLAHTNVAMVSTTGDININAPVHWNPARSLTLTASTNLNINQTITSTGANSAVRMTAGDQILINKNVALSGASGHLSLDASNGYALQNRASITLSGRGATFSANNIAATVIQTVADLQAVNNDLQGQYVLGNNLTGSGVFRSIGGNNGAFSGNFDGLGNTLHKFSVANAGPNLGIFAASSGKIGNLHLNSMTVNAGNFKGGPMAIGSLVGVNTGIIHDVTGKWVVVNGSANQSNIVGGLVGVNAGGFIDQSSLSGDVHTRSQTVSAGGLVGENQANGVISRSWSNISVSGPMNRNSKGGMGGLVGANSGSLLAVYSIGNITGKTDGINVGGLAGINTGMISDTHTSLHTQAGRDGNTGGLVGLNQGSIEGATSYGSVTVSGGASTGGLVGLNDGGLLEHVRATGAVHDARGANVGGLVGSNHNGMIASAQASGTVTSRNRKSGARVGGFAGYNDGVIETSSASGTVHGGNNASVGGFAGVNDGSLIAVAATGAVNGDSQSAVGGLVGTNGGKIDTGRANGNVWGSYSSRIGGVAGENLDSGKIFNASAKGQLSSGMRATMGGLAGINHGLIEQSTFTGGIKTVWWRGQTYGGLVGRNAGELNQNKVLGAAALLNNAGVDHGRINP